MRSFIKMKIFKEIFLILAGAAALLGGLAMILRAELLNGIILAGIILIGIGAACLAYLIKSEMERGKNGK